jgi:uncharacterized membrane protein YbhN (UPF0104 family)
MISLDWIAAELRPLYDGGEPVLDRVGAVSLLPFAVALTLHFAKLGALGRAWHNIVRAAYPADRVGFREALAAFLAGVGVGAFVPSRVGELVRLGLLRGRLASATFPGLLSTLLAEQVFEVILKALVIAVAVGVGFRAGVPGSAFIRGPVAHHPLAATLAGAGAALSAGWLAMRLRARIRPFFVEARRGLAVFAHPTRYLRTVASWQALAWALRLGSAYWFLVAFHVPATLGAALLVVAVQLLAAVVPVTPGGAGPQQAMLVVALSASATATVLGFGIGMQAATVLCDLVLGAASLIFLTGSVRWRRLALRRDWPVPQPVAPPRPAGGL